MKHWLQQKKNRPLPPLELLSVQEVVHNGNVFVLENWRIIEEEVEQW